MDPPDRIVSVWFQHHGQGPLGMVSLGKLDTFRLQPFVQES